MRSWHDLLTSRFRFLCLGGSQLKSTGAKSDEAKGADKAEVANASVEGRVRLTADRSALLMFFRLSLMYLVCSQQNNSFLFMLSEKVEPGDIVIPGEKDVVPVGKLKYEMNINFNTCSMLLIDTLPFQVSKIVGCVLVTYDI